MQSLAGRGTLFVAAITIILHAASLGSLNARAADSSSQLSLPYSTGQSWYFYGPHNYNEVFNGPWNSLDFSGGDSHVKAARGGVVYRDCSAGFVRIDHGDGYETTYYHLINIQVAAGQVVSRGQYIGDTGTDLSCGGTAMGAHVHFSLWFFTPPSSFNLNSNSQMKDLGGVQIGNWVVSRGSDQYYAIPLAARSRPGPSLAPAPPSIRTPT
jgi:LasA protease